MMSNDIQKADQIAYRFYVKLCLVVHDARSTAEQRTPARVDKWFNLETSDYDLYRDTLRIYRSISSSPPPSTFELQVLLTVPDLSSNQVLVHLSPDHSRLRIDPTPQHIVLESWLVHFSPSSHHAMTTSHTSDHSDEHPGDVAPSTIYKHGIPLFRSLYSLLRILPTWKLCKRLRRRMSTPYRNGNLTVQLRICGSDDGIGHVLEFDDPPASNTSPLPYEKHTFPSIPHPMGMLSLSAKYLTSPNFQLDELESLLSSRFLSLDEASDFTPTLAKNQARDSMSALAGPSTSLRTSLPRSPPSSIAGQFILPPPGHPGTHVRTQSLSSVPGSQSPKTGHVALPISRTTTTTTAGAGSSSGLSFASSRQEGSGTWSKEEGALPSLARLRRESISTTGRSATDLPGALPIRRSGITPVHPFKSSTLSSGSPSIHSPSPSLRHPSPLSTGNIIPPLSSNPTLPSLPSRVQTSPRVPPSPIGMGISGHGGKPSPPFAPSSLGDRDRRRSMTSADGVDLTPGSFGATGAGSGVAGASADANTSPSMTTNVSTSPSPRIGRGRYRSSFGHRYSPGGSGGGGVGAGGEGSTGSAGGGGGGAVTSGGPAIEHDRVRELSQEGGGKRDISQEGVNRDGSGSNRERGRTTSFLAASTDDDELSMFVQEIDARKPLTSTTGRSVVGRVEGSSRGSPSSLSRGGGDPSGVGLNPGDADHGSGERADIGLGIGLTAGGSGAHEQPERDSTGHRRSSSSISAGPMLTREAEVDERLKYMNEMFLASLEGLGYGTGRSRSSEQVGVGRDGDDASPGTRSLGEGGGSSGGSVSGSGVRRPRLRSMRSFSGGDVASSGGSAEVIGRLELDEDSKRRRWGE
ncbi:autophagy-related protein 13-domain-containing protein [Pisolithus sp. B1]|nr:autophagy-related protein 13-domain-containing protein [Pisolithus sp. B1]